MDKNLNLIRSAFQDSSDFVLKQLRVGKRQTRFALLFLSGLTNEQTIQENILRPLLASNPASLQAVNVQELILEVGDTQFATDLDAVISEVLRGQVVLLWDGSIRAIVVDARKYQGRQITEPKAESTITGPRDGFVEDLGQNLALVRRRLPTTSFKSSLIHLGTVTQTAVAICYLENLVDEKLLQEVLQRLQNLKQLEPTTVLDTSFIGQSIEDHPKSPFPQTAATERPDRTVSSLLHGKICLLVDGCPSALIVPVSLPDMFRSQEDIYLRPMAATVNLWLRYFSAVIGTTASAAYVAVMTFHYEVIPQRLVTSVAQNRTMVPFPSLFEALVLEAAVELLREATNRLPNTVGQVIGVVGALVLGQAAVQANLISPLLVIVVAISTIASFTIPNDPNSTALRQMRFPLILAGGLLGGFGIVFVWTIILTEWASLDSFGRPYLSPLVPLRGGQAARQAIARPIRQNEDEK